MKSGLQWGMFAKRCVLLMLAVGLSMPGVASAADTGWVSPTTAPGNYGVSNASNAFADGGGYATFSGSGTGVYYGGYNFSIPPGSTITAIAVRLDAWNTTGCLAQKYVRVYNGTAWYPTSSPYPTITANTIETTYEVGNDLWGHTWTTDELLTWNFQILVGLQNGCESYLDWAPVKVTYNPPGGPQIPTLSKGGLVAFILLLAAGAIVVMRRRMRGEP